MAIPSAHIHGKKFALYGDPDLTLGLAGFLMELGAEPVHILSTNGGKAVGGAGQGAARELAVRQELPRLSG